MIYYFVLNYRALKKITITLYLSIFVGIFCSTIQAQDIHFSQFFNSPLNVNPALTGIFNGEKQIYLGYRNQWASVPVPYTTFTLAYDQKIYPKYNDKYFWGLGFVANYDYQGDSKLAVTNLKILANYSYIINPRNIISFGLDLNGDQRKFNEGNLRWGNQWNGDRFDPNRATGENYERTDYFFFDIGAGINYRYQKNNRSWMNLGVGGFHLIQPVQSFYNNDVQTTLPIRLSGVFNSSIKMGTGFDLLLNGLYQTQGVYSETVLSLMGRFYLNVKPGQQLALDIGGGTRLNDAWIIMMGLNNKNWYVGLSYDITNSGFKVANNSRGGPEVHFRYNIFRVDPLDTYKKCPIY